MFLGFGLCCFSTFTLYLRLFLSYVFDFGYAVSISLLYTRLFLRCLFSLGLCCFSTFALFIFFFLFLFFLFSGVPSDLGYVVSAPLLYSRLFLRFLLCCFSTFALFTFAGVQVSLFYACFALACSVSLVRLFPWSSPSVLYCLEPGNHTASVRNLVTAKSEEIP